MSRFQSLDAILQFLRRKLVHHTVPTLMLVLVTHVHVCFSASKMDDFSVREMAKLAIWCDTTDSVVQTQRMSRAEFPDLTPRDFFLCGYVFEVRRIPPEAQRLRRLRTLARRLSSRLSIVPFRIQE